MRTLLLLVCLAVPMAAQEQKIAVIGLVHSHVWGHLGKMIEGKPAKLVGIAEREPELVAEAKRRGAAAELIFDDYRKMVEQTKPDIVWAFVENNRHREVVEYLAPKKIHVMFEKPLASTFKDAQAIQKLAREHGIRVLTNYQMAWWPANHAAKRLFDEGTVGKVTRLRGVVGHGGPGQPEGLNKYFFNWLTDPVQNGAGALMDFGCYNVLWSLWYLGRPQTVYATVQHNQPQRFPKVEDHATLVLTYPNATGVFEGSWDLPRSFQELEVFGLGGSLFMRSGLVETRKGREAAVAVPLAALPAEQGEPIAAMIAAIKSGRPVEGITALDINAEVVEIIEAAKESVRTGRAVRLPQR